MPDGLDVMTHHFRLLEDDGFIPLREGRKRRMADAKAARAGAAPCM